MGWLTALIAVAVFVWLLIAFPRFRIIALLVIAGLALSVFLMVRSEQISKQKSHALISVSQLNLKDVTLRPSYTLWEVTGTVTNNSSYTLRDFRMKVTIRDCPDESCVVIGEEEVFLWVEVPPAQMRSFKGEVFLDHMPRPKKMSWSYQIVQIAAE
jgi:hypothetical protein